MITFLNLNKIPKLFLKWQRGVAFENANCFSSLKFLFGKNRQGLTSGPCYSKYSISITKSAPLPKYP